MNNHWQQLVRARLAPLRLPPHRERDIVEEVALHLEAIYDDALAEGLSETEAQTRAMQSYDWRLLECELSRVERAPLQSSNGWLERKGGNRMNSCWQDLHFGARRLMKQPGFTLIAIVMFSLGIGATAAMFSVVHAVLIRPLAFHEPERLVWLTNANPALGVAQTFLNPEDILDCREQAQSLEQVASWGTFPQNLTGGRGAERVESIYVTPNFFRTLGVAPLLGRDFLPEENGEDSHPLIISYGLWQRQFNGAAEVIGRKIVLNGADTGFIVGVLPPGLNFPQHVDLFETYDYQRGWGRGGSHNDRTLARFKAGYTVAQAQAELDVIAQRQARLFPETNKGWRFVVTPFREHLFGSARLALPLLLGAVGMLLLLACTNVAGLQLARAVTRQKEWAIRLALGAGRGRVIRQLLTETLLLALAGSLSGLWLAQGVLALVRTWGANALPRLNEARLDPLTLAFTAAVTLLSAVLAGLAPAWRMSRLDLNAVLAGAGNTGAVAPPIQRFRRALVVTQFALAMALLVGAGLLMRSFWQLQQASPGFDYENVLSAGVSLNFAQFRELPQRQTIFRRALERVSALPGVESAAGISHLPFGGRTMQHECRLVSQPQREGLVDYRVVTPGLFETLRIPLQRGRGFTERDTHNAAPVCIVNEAFVRAYFANVNPLGEQLRLGFDGGMRGEIIGVVGDLQHRGLEAAAVPTVYVSDLQCGPFSNSPIFNFVLRTRGDALTLAESARQTLQEAAPQQVVFNVRPLNDWVADSLAQRRFSMSLLAAFAALALCLAGAGLAGAMSYLVTQQTREIGLRQALGATRADVLRFVLKQGVGLSLAGIAAGAFAALALTRAMRGLLYGVSANDPGTFLLMALLLLSLALAACVIPARRAMRVDPLTALRHE